MNIKTKARRLAAAALVLAFCTLFTGCTAIKNFLKAAYDASATEAPVITEAPTDGADQLTPGPEITLSPRTAETEFADVVLPRKTELNYFAIPDIILSLMTEGDIGLYKSVVTAYLAGETSVAVPAEYEDHPNLWRVVDMYFPVFFADVNDKTIAEGKGGISWKYSGTASEHESAIDAFELAVQDHLRDVNRSDTLLMQILTAYQSFTSKIEYNGNTTVPGDDFAPYVHRHAADAILENTGVCWCFARAFNFLICQLGAESLTVHGLRTGDQAIHEWVCFRHGDEWRYCDPTWDLGGRGLTYFGFTIRAREFQGYAERWVTVLEGTEHRASQYFNVSDNFFAPLTSGLCSGSRYTLDRENNEVVFMSWEDDTPFIAFDLETGATRDLVP